MYEEDYPYAEVELRVTVRMSREQLAEYDPDFIGEDGPKLPELTADLAAHLPLVIRGEKMPLDYDRGDVEVAVA